jgi:hypothetical protein
MAPTIKVEIDREKVESQVVLALVHRGQNRELLEDIPHREWNDLAIVYRWAIDGQAGMASLVTHKLAGMVGMDERGLFSAASRNTLRLYPPKIQGMPDLLGELAKNGVPGGIPDIPHGDNWMYVITNDRHLYGAAGVLYGDILQGLADRIGGDFYLIPSSVHEMIAIPAKGSPETLAGMVGEVNYNLVALDEQLSNQVYLYSVQTGEVTMATDLPFEGLRSCSGPAWE